MAKRDYYEVLGVDKSADEGTIKKAYRQLAKKYHPDMNPGDANAEARFKEVNEAYAILSDPEKRAAYDSYGHAAFEGGAGAGGGSAGGFGFDMGDIDLGDIFGSMFGFGGSSQKRKNAPLRGEDIGYAINVTFEEAAFGCKKEMEFSRIARCAECNGSGSKDGKTETCSTCGGSGQRRVTQRLGGMAFQSTTTCEACRGTGKIIKEPCPKCRGNGMTKQQKKITVTVPAGIDNGGRIALRGMGNDGPNGGPAGDLIVEVRVRNHPTFERRGYDIYCDVPITFAEAALGAEIDVPTLEGNKKFTIPEGTQTGTSFSMRGLGTCRIDYPDRRGDLIFTVIVETPKGLNSKQKELLAQFAEACGESNYTKKQRFFRKNK
ncbi:MAG: molecular chaperone DnaJ [Eubacteriales bacterium]